LFKKLLYILHINTIVSDKTEKSANRTMKNESARVLSAID